MTSGDNPMITSGGGAAPFTRCGGPGRFPVGMVVLSVLPASTRRSGGHAAERAVRRALRQRRLPTDGDPALLRRA
ncbi:hypothetical protein E4P41_00200 [Geodermatophilus sp. DF01-2]|uniref:hypothetical protein n=1 Tax=Geodermatophilus sp. DF01-2 TaxID=2559610 RepID=UPI0010738CE4|nr:hypothetical protein [Geodermatophilus sp. DF01_2]TFV64705.1 hypothetical protein E4P41_00200 [Geodermatophilus sp. DF01_2]